MLRDKTNFEDILERVPDEFYNWVKETKVSLIAQYQQIEDAAKLDFETNRTYAKRKSDVKRKKDSSKSNGKKVYYARLLSVSVK